MLELTIIHLLMPERQLEFKEKICWEHTYSISDNFYIHVYDSTTIIKINMWVKCLMFIH